MSKYTPTGGEAIPALEAFGTPAEAAAIHDLTETFGAFVAVGACAKLAMHIARLIGAPGDMSGSDILAVVLERTAERSPGDRLLCRFSREVWFWQRTFERTGNPYMEIDIYGAGEADFQESLAAGLSFTDQLLTLGGELGVSRDDLIQDCRTSVLQFIASSGARS